MHSSVSDNSIVKKSILFQAIQIIQTVLCQIIQFIISTQFECQNSAISSNSV